jgi:WhiB family redox-sensing transcriptional regulator
MSGAGTSAEAMAWLRDAACSDEDPELFFPVGESGPAKAQLERAKAVCARCPVRERCLAWALESGQNSGVWGGTHAEERRRLYRSASRRAPRSGRPETALVRRR